MQCTAVRLGHGVVHRLHARRRPPFSEHQSSATALGDMVDSAPQIRGIQSVSPREIAERHGLWRSRTSRAPRSGEAVESVHR